MEHKSLYETLGKHEGLRKVVNKMFDLMLFDENVKHYYDKVTDMNKLKELYTDFLSRLFGGPELYQGKNIKEIHAPFKLSEKDFNVFTIHLMEAMKQLSVPDKNAHDASLLVEGVKKQIISSTI